MAAIRHLNKAPLEEAIVDFSVVLPTDFAPERFSAVTSLLRPAYPVAEEYRVGEDGEEPLTLRGYLFKSEDGVNIAQFRTDGFSLNRLPPYHNWNDFRTEALRLWGIYTDVASPRRIERLTLRYINRLAIPTTGKLADFLEIRPPSFLGTPDWISTFVLSVNTHDPATRYFATVMESLEYPPDEKQAAILLDIDTYRVDPGSDPREITSTLEHLHGMKNEIFFGSITEQTAERYA